LPRGWPRGGSRSELHASAAAEFVKAERFRGVREPLDAVYGRDAAQRDLDPARARAVARAHRGRVVVRRVDIWWASHPEPRGGGPGRVVELPRVQVRLAR
jgi:hypothetical protein